MADEMHTMRLGWHDRANYLPLLYPLQAGWVAPPSPWGLEIVNEPPAELADGLLDGRLDAAFVPPGALARHGDKFKSLGGWGLACEGRVETAVLLAPKRLDLMHDGDVSITPAALGSTAEHLLRTLLTPYYNIHLELHPPDDPAYDAQGARLLYGDDAAREAANKRGDWVAEDLGVAAFVFTGLPMVWEMLAAAGGLEERKPGAGEQIQALLKLSQRTAREQADTVLQAASERLGLERQAVKELFARQRYALGDAEQKGLARFLAQAAQARVL